MENSNKVNQILLIGTGLLLIVPMFIFPSQFGTDLIKPAMVNALYELVFYGVVLFFFNRKTNLIKLFQGAGLCLVYRLGVGLLLGTVISLSYSMKFSISVQLAMSSYLPAILLHILFTPLVLRSAILPVLGVKSAPVRLNTNRALDGSEPGGTTSIAISRTQGVVMAQTEADQIISDKPARDPISKQLSPTHGINDGTNGFDRAVRYIGEHGSVYMSAVVDHEGLLLSQFKRGKFIPEDYAPLAQLLTQDNSRSLYRKGYDFSELEKIDLGLKNERIVICKHPFCTLVVIAERQSDDLLNIRINQGMEIISKYSESRYPMTKTSKMENEYVPSTE